MEIGDPAMTDAVAGAPDADSPPVDETRASFEAAFAAFKELALADPARYYFAAWHFHEAKRHILALEAENGVLRARVAECEAALEGVDELAAEGVNQFSLQEARRDFLDIRDVVADALVLLRSQAARPHAADTDTVGGRLASFDAGEGEVY